MEILYLLFISFFIKVYSQIKKNPINLADGGYPFVLTTEDNDNYYYILTEIKDVKIEKKSSNFIDSSGDVLISPNSIYATDSSNNNYIVNELNECFMIRYDNFISSEMIEFNSLNFENPEEVKKIGSIKHNNEEDFIIYGYYEEHLFFSSKSQSSYLITDIMNGINDRTSCKLIMGDYFICAMNINNETFIHFLHYNIKEEEPESNFLNSFKQIEFSYSDGVAFYDTPQGNIKLLCLKQKESINCSFYEINNYQENGNYEFELLNEINVDIDWSNGFSENNCYFSEFNSEFLFCCATNELICFRIDKNNYQLIKYYKLATEGENSHLTIKSNKEFITLFYMNTKDDNVQTLLYYIYLPTCENKNYTILNSINWNKSENEMERLSNLFKVETNINYFRIINKPNDYGYFILNDEKVQTAPILISDNNYILDFIVTNNNINEEINLIVNYSISAEDDAYTKECQIELKILPCYNRCEICSKDNSDSNFTQQNCIKCKNDYFFLQKKMEVAILMRKRR